MRLQLIGRLCIVLWPVMAVVSAPLALAQSPPGGSSGGSDETQVTSDALVYTDTDSVFVFSPQVTARRQLDDDGGQVNARAVVDAITAASVDVISNATYRFSEVRTQAELGLSKRIGEFLPSARYRYSGEPDYQSHGFGAGLERRLAGADTVLSASYNLTLDRIGRVGTPAEIFSESLTSHAAEVGITQVIDTRTLLRVVYSFTGQLGYMEKPYRSVPLFDQAGLDAAQAAGVALDLDTYDSYRLQVRPSEEVPDDRYRHAVAVRGLRYIDSLQASLRLDYRLYGDSWGILAHTAEIGVRRALNRCWRLEAWNRTHYQSSASFWQRTYMVSGPTAIPALRTMDRSLSRSFHNTLGGRGEWTRGALSSYFEFAAMYSYFPDFLLIDSRLAILSQVGIRWNF